jgi:hypothetical protein
MGSTHPFEDGCLVEGHLNLKGIPALAGLVLRLNREL